MHKNSIKKTIKLNGLTIYIIMVSLMIFLLLLFLGYAVGNGTIEEAREGIALHLIHDETEDHHIITVPSGIYTTSVFTNLFEYSENTPGRILAISMLSTAILVLCLVYLLILVISRIKEYSKPLLFAIIFLTVRMFSVDCAVIFYMIFSIDFSWSVSIIFYVTTALSCFFLVAAADKYIQDKTNHRLLILVGTYYLFVLLGVLGSVIQPEYFFLEQHIRMALLIPLFYMVVKLYKPAKEDVLFIVPAMIGYIAVVTGLFVDTMYLSAWIPIDLFWFYPVTMCILLICMIDIYYQKVVLAKQKEAYELANMRNELEQKNIALMMSQIQPHFMYNTLQAIQVLCRKDSDTAQKTIVKFSEYLRHNMDFVEMKGLISFKEDFNHIKCYVDIEQIRFQERLRMAYDIQVDDFMIPPLSIQPLVENAIKHGICKKAEGGTVIVRTRKEANRIIIEVMDNGIGFDTAILKETNTKSMGTRNVRFRLEHMVGATLTIKSIPGEGTYQVVSIPQEENKNENYNC